MKHRYAIIIAGGKGERFWPKSRFKKPKYLISFEGKESLLQQTLKRVQSFIPNKHIFILTNQYQKLTILNELPHLESEQIIAEPVGRNTGPSIALSMLILKRKDPQAVCVVLPADQLIDSEKNFKLTLIRAFKIAETKQGIVTIGIIPHYPATGYGYLLKGDIVESGIFKVDQFIEKPKKEMANFYFKKGSYYWNSGMYGAALGGHKELVDLFIDKGADWWD